MHVTVDDSTATLLGLLRQALQQEPEAVDLDVHVGHHAEEVARTHGEWARHVAALRLLLGHRLVALALADNDG